MSKLQYTSPIAEQIGFTEQLFSGELFVRDGTIIVVSIRARIRGKGHFSRLVNSALLHGYHVQIHYPVGIQMRGYVSEKGFTQLSECAEIWEKQSDARRHEQCLIDNTLAFFR